MNDLFPPFNKVWRTFEKMACVNPWWYYIATIYEGETMPKQARNVVALRMEDVERALLNEPWTLATQRVLADRHNVQPRQIRDDAKKIRDAWTEQAMDTNPHEAKADWVNRVRMAQYEARSNGQTIALSRLLSLEARCMGYEAPVNVNVNHTVEALDPVSQAKAIVQYYPDAVRLLDAAGESAPVIDAVYIEDKTP